MVDSHFNMNHSSGLQKEMATHSSILAWEIPWTGSLVGYSLWVGHVLVTKQHHHSSGCEVVSHCRFNLYFPDALICLLLWSFLHDFCPFLDLSVFLLLTINNSTCLCDKEIKWKWKLLSPVLLFCDPMDRRLPGSCVSEILQARILLQGIFPTRGSNLGLYDMKV